MSIAAMLKSQGVVFIKADLEGIVGAEGLHTIEGVIKVRRVGRREKNRRDKKVRRIWKNARSSSP